MVALTREDNEIRQLTQTIPGITSEKEWADHKATLDPAKIAASGKKPAIEPDGAKKSGWDNRFVQHCLNLAMNELTLDGKPWKPAAGSLFRAVSSLTNR